MNGAIAMIFEEVVVELVVIKASRLRELVKNEDAKSPFVVCAAVVWGWGGQLQVGFSVEPVT